MPAAAAIPWLGTAIAGVAGGTAAVVGAKMQSNSARDSADKQTVAANHAADLQDAAAQRAEVFSRQQAENAWQNQQATQRANYEQQKARFGTIAGLAGQYGLNVGAMPDYVAGVDPRYTDSSMSLPSSATAPPAAGTIAGATPQGIDWTAPAPQLGASLSAYFKSKGVSDQEVPYWVSKAPELVARGKEINDPEYANKRLAAADVFGGGSSAPKGSIAGMSGMVAPMAAPLPVNTAIPTPYQPGTIASYGRMR